VKKLFNLKQWLTVPDAARHLSNLFEEDVSEADVLRLALDGHLILSVDFVNRAKGRPGRLVPLQDAKRLKTMSLQNEPLDLIQGVQIGDQVIEFDERVVTLEGVWDLKMQGAERIDVEHRYQHQTGGPSVDLQSLDGPIVFRQNGMHCQLLEHFADGEHFDQKTLKEQLSHPDKYYPAGGLPADSVLVVRTSALHDLEARLAEPDQKAETPIGRRERTTMLVIIAALAELPKIDLKKPSSAAQAIESQTIQMGARVSARAIEDHLKRIPDALEARG
jgi:hypothetical protein